MSTFEDDLRRYGEAAELAAIRQSPPATPSASLGKGRLLVLRAAAAVLVVVGAGIWFMANGSGPDAIVGTATGRAQETPPTSTSAPSTTSASSVEPAPFPPYLSAIPDRPADAGARVPTLLPVDVYLFGAIADGAGWRYEEAVARDGTVASTLRNGRATVWIAADMPLQPFNAVDAVDAGAVAVEGQRATYYVTDGDDCDGPGNPATVTQFVIDGVRYTVEVSPPAHCIELSPQEIGSWIDEFTVVRAAELPEGQLRLVGQRAAVPKGEPSLALAEAAHRNGRLLLDLTFADGSKFPRGALLLLCDPGWTTAADSALCRQATLPVADLAGAAELPLDFTSFNEAVFLDSGKTFNCAGSDGCLVVAAVAAPSLSDIDEVLGHALFFLQRS